MNENNKNIQNPVSDQQLEDIIGGYETVLPGHGGNVALLNLITSNRGTYSSGSEPKYRVGQHLKIKCNYCDETKLIPCTVISVSETADMGVIYKEFGYTVETHCDSIPELQGKIVPHVYESCLYQ